MHAQNKAEKYAIFLWHTPKQTAMYLESLAEAKFSDATHLYWHKTEHGVHGTPVSQFTSSVEMGTLAFFPSRGEVTVNLNVDPRLRHNFIECPGLTKKYKDTTGQVVNPSQKPHELAAWLVVSMCIPGSTVLVIGAGAGGGEVLGALSKNCNVVCLENNVTQFDGLFRHLLQVKEDIRIKEAKEAADRLKLDPNDESVPESQVFSQGPQYLPPDSQSSLIIKCGLCGRPMGEETPFKCYAQERCVDLVFHEECTEIYKEVSSCKDCITDAVNMLHEAETQSPSE